MPTIKPRPVAAVFWGTSNTIWWCGHPWKTSGFKFDLHICPKTDYCFKSMLMVLGWKIRFLGTFALGPNWRGPLGTPGHQLTLCALQRVGLYSESARVQFHQLHLQCTVQTIKVHTPKCKFRAVSCADNAPIWLHTCCSKATLLLASPRLILPPPDAVSVLTSDCSDPVIG